VIALVAPFFFSRTWSPDGCARGKSVRICTIRFLWRHAGALEQADTLWPRSRGDLQIGAVLQVFVKDNNIDQALRVLKKRLQREGLFREMKRRRAYEKPSERRIRERAEAVRRRNKLARKKAVSEGLIAAPKKVLKKPGVAAPR
jgi:small subunit ribosomal protein S21